MNYFKLIAQTFLFFIAISLTVSCSQEEENENPMENPDPVDIELKLSNDATLGTILTDENGVSLYFFSNDSDGNSQCESGCLNNWPIYYKADLKAGTGVDVSQIGTITRADGSKQNTYRGWPLYYFSGDNTPGDVNGEAAGGNWFVAKPDYSLMLAKAEVDGNATQILVDGDGKTLYIFTNDEPNVSNCSGGCLSSWPTFDAGVVVAPSTLSIDKFNSIPGNANAPQTTWNQQPLYFFAQDTNRGNINGQGAGNSWFVLDIETLLN